MEVTSEKKFKSVFMVSCAVLCKKEGMADYFKNNSKDFYLVTVIPKHLKGQLPKCTHFVNSEEKEVFNLLTVPEVLSKKCNYVTHVGYMLSIIYAFIRIHKKLEIFVGEGHLYSLTGVLLKSLGLIKRIIYSSGDYFTDVKSFLVIDKFISKHVDAIWNSTKTMTKTREQRDLGKKIAYQTEMPLGLYIREKVSSNRPSDAHGILFMGNVQIHQGVDILIEAVSKLKAAGLDVVLHLVGQGPYLEEVKRKVGDNAVFYGFVDDDAVLEEIMTKCFVGVAMYDPVVSSFTKMADPGKIKDYLSAGLPIITTDITAVSKEINETNAGIVSDYSTEAVTTALTTIYNARTSQAYYTGARTLAKKYVWQDVMHKVVEATLQAWK